MTWLFDPDSRIQKMSDTWKIVALFVVITKSDSDNQSSTFFDSNRWLLAPFQTAPGPR